jgi:Rrf2 family protein
MKLSRTVWYALQAGLLLAELDHDAPVPCSRLASAGNMPERFLLQILRNLVAHGILRSVRGVDGGYALSKPADDISVLDLIEAVEGPIAADLPVEHLVPRQASERLGRMLTDITEAARHELGRVTLAGLLAGPRGPAPSSAE